jgi:PAS domain S-box-containing protein
MTKEEQLLQKQKELEEAHEELHAINNELEEVNARLGQRNAELQATYNQLKISEGNFRQLAENTTDMFWLRDSQKIIYVNNQFEKIWGRRKEDLLKNPLIILDWIHPDDRKIAEAWVKISDLLPGQPLVEHYRILKPDGEIRWLLSRSFVVNDEEDIPYRMVGIISDITEQKDFEEALRIAKEQAQESDMLKSTFLANISHEIRTPMNGIVGFAELLSRDDLDSNTRRSYVNIMKKNSEQLICIIDDIIDFAKIEANQIHIARETVRLNSLIDQLKLFYESHLQKNNNQSIAILIEKVLSDEESEIISDEHRIRQIISYLIDNSIKYTSDGFIKFGYTIEEKKVVFFVQDTGLGIPSEKHELIFERFRQVDEGHTRKYGGTGLGLPISKGLVDLLGGEIWLDSEVNKGTTFYFTVPYRQDKRSGEVPSTGTLWEEKFNWKDKLILVAEDDELNFEYMKALLEPTYARVIRAKDGSQAVKICSNLDFDIILMDIRLPVLNGIQATRHLRDLGIKTPIIAQTAFAMDNDEQKCLEAGCNKYIAKPISKEKLFLMIDELLVLKPNEAE